MFPSIRLSAAFSLVEFGFVVYGVSHLFFYVLPNNVRKLMSWIRHLKNSPCPPEVCDKRSVLDPSRIILEHQVTIALVTSASTFTRTTAQSFLWFEWIDPGNKSRLLSSRVELRNQQNGPLERRLAVCVQFATNPQSAENLLGLSTHQLKFARIDPYMIPEGVDIHAKLDGLGGNLSWADLNGSGWALELLQNKFGLTELNSNSLHFVTTQRSLTQMVRAVYFSWIY